MAFVDPGYQLLACRYLREQLDRLTEELRGVRRNEDIEPVHQARVASRRMRAAFRMFSDCLEGKQITQWRKRIKALTRGLGAARDKDVQIAFVEEFRAGLADGDKRNAPGVRRLLLRLRQDREALQPAVIRTLDKLERGNALAEMHGELEKNLFMLRGHEAQVQSPLVRAQTAGHIRRRRDDLLALAHTLTGPRDLTGHHQLRIAAKRLRYTMEICNPAHDGKLTPFVKSVKKMQSFLGDIHDCDVWVDDIDAFVEQERARALDYFGHDRPFRRLKPGLSLLCDERKRHREQTFVELVACWEKLGAEHFWDELEVVLQADEPAACPQEPETLDGSSDGKEEEIQEDRTAQ